MELMSFSILTIYTTMDCPGMPYVSCLEESDSGDETSARVERVEKGMCGRSRPIFFRGVPTVVTKLFNIVELDVAVFEKKDYQQ
uniref:Pantoate--beta-alanine ligase n=1 Tax=Cucumis sativus TaxID=3659 RepID=A0A0A0L9F0_CUCSA